MLKNEERIAEVKRRIGEKERQQRLRHRRIVSAFCIAACLAVIVGVSFAMPGIIGQIEPVLLQALKQQQQFWAAAPHWDIW
jgi:hypothetical protein